MLRRAALSPMKHRSKWSTVASTDDTSRFRRFRQLICGTLMSERTQSVRALAISAKATADQLETREVYMQVENPPAFVHVVHVEVASDTSAVQVALSVDAASVQVVPSDVAADVTERTPQRCEPRSWDR